MTGLDETTSQWQTEFPQNIQSQKDSKVHITDQLLQEKEEDLIFMKETLQRSKKELEVALSDMSFYQELACQLQKDALSYLSFVQDIRSAVGSTGTHQSLEELLQVLLHKLDVKIEDCAKNSHFQLSCPEELQLDVERKTCCNILARGGVDTDSKAVQKVVEEGRASARKCSSWSK